MYDYISLHKEQLRIEYKSTYKTIDYESILNKYKKNYCNNVLN